MYHTEKPRDMIVRAKKLRAKFETWNVQFKEKEFVTDIVIPALSPTYAEVTEQLADVSVMAVQTFSLI